MFVRKFVMERSQESLLGISDRSLGAAQHLALLYSELQDGQGCVEETISQKKRKEQRQKGKKGRRKEKKLSWNMEKKLMNRKINKLKLISLSYGKQADSSQVDPNT